MAATAVPVILSPNQRAVAAVLCVGGTSPTDVLVARTGTNAATLTTLCRLGVIEIRRVGGLAALCHLTDFGRDLVCGQEDDGYAVNDDPLPAKEVPMNDTDTATVKPDPKPAAKKRSSRKKAEPAAVAPPIVDAPAEPASKQTLQPLFDDLLGAVKEAVKAEKPVVEDKAAYTRVSVLGKAAIYINHPTTKAVRVEVPQKEGSGYDVIKATTPDDFPKVLELVAARVSTLKEKAAAKAAK